ncbi:hypothetical protein Emed_001742 [Eimeria media]
MAGSTAGQQPALPSLEREASYQHESQWDVEGNTKTASELWAPESLTVEDRLSADDASILHDGLSAVSVPPINVSTILRKNERSRKRVSLLSKGLASAAIAASLALLLLKLGKAERGVKPQPFGAPAAIRSDLELLKKIREAAEHLDALLGEPEIEGLAMTIGKRVKQLEEAYALLQQQASREKVKERSKSELALAEEAKKRCDEGLSDLLDDANKLLELTLPSIRQYSLAPSRKADVLRESAEASKALWAAAPPAFSDRHIELVEHFASDAEKNKQEVSVLATLAEKSAHATAGDLREAVERLERTASLMARMGRLSWRCTKDEDLYLRWSQVATDRLMRAAQMEGAHLRTSLDALREQASLTNLNAEAAAVASQYSNLLNEVQDIHRRAPTMQQLVLEKDPVALLTMVEQLRTATNEAREKASLALEGIRSELNDNSDSKVREADLYKDDEVTIKIFAGLVEKQAALAEGSASLMKARLREMQHVPEDAHKQVKEARRLAALCSENAENQGRHAREAARQAAGASTIGEAHSQLLSVSGVFEESRASSREMGRLGLREAAWEYLDATAREAMRQVGEAAKRLTLMGETNIETIAKVAEIQNHVCMLVEHFSEAEELSPAFGYLLDLRDIMKHTH